MKQGDVKKIIITFMLLLLLCACGENEKSTVGDTNTVISDIVSPTVTDKATEDNADPAKDRESSTGESQEETQEQSSVEEHSIFRTGTWAVTKPDGSSVFMSICADNTTIRRNINDGKSEEFKEGARPEELYLMAIEQTDEDRYVCHENNGDELVFEYVSAKSDDFEFFSDEKLRSRAVGMFMRSRKEIQTKMDAEIKDSKWDKAVVTVRSGPIKESYRLDRFTGEGKRINEE